MRFWSLLCFAISVFLTFDGILWLLCGTGISGLLGGAESPVVAAIAEQITGMGTDMFAVITAISVFVSVYICYALYRGEKGSVRR